ncbi:acyltransferase family protein [Pseudomonas abieticivorans]|uniref:acyltransferase family protein n=1 Tax=Pseudomonas abieticivorans TaxID=2931382 RepID=UPI0020BDAE22|nr:acyltransferase [Pseudomonas sp. PIA16]
MSRLAYLDSLRGIAAVLVVVTHLWLPSWSMPNHFLLDIGKMGVIWFFLLSGVVIPFSLQPGPGGARRFIVSRGLRLYPTYWLSMAVFVAMLVLTHAELPSGRTVIANLTMLQAALGYSDVVGLYWTLFIEWVFYALCLGLMLTGKLHNTVFRALCALGLLLVALAMGLARMLLQRKLPVALPLGLSLMLFGSIWRDWILGQANATSKRCAVALLGAFIVVLPPTFYTAYSFDTGLGEYWVRYLFTYALAIGSFLVLTQRVRLQQPLLLWLGTRSYSLYLLHPSMALLAGYWLGNATPSTLLALVATSLAFLAAHLSYRYVELPFMQLSKRLNGKARAPMPFVPELQVPQKTSNRP